VAGIVVPLIRLLSSFVLEYTPIRVKTGINHKFNSG
jgi:hypothetical protein